MQQTSDGSQEAAFHKLCQLQKLVATYISALEEKQFHREFIDSIFYPQIQNIIANCQSTINKISKEGKLQKEKISKTITSQFQTMIDKKVSQLNKFIKEKVELVNENSKQFHSELHDMGLSVKQFSHNIETSMNALETQKKSTEKYLYEEMKRLDAKLVKDKMEYSQNIERKILELQETTNKTVKALTEIHINKQNILQKEFILSLPKNTINVKKMRSIKEKLKKFKLNISNMQNSINSLIHAEHNHSTSMKDSVNKLCELIKDELEAVNSKNPKTCNIYKNLDENLKKIIMEIKSRNNQVIIEKMEEIKKLEETRNDLVKKYEIILREKEKHNKEKSKIEKEEINSLSKSFIVEISECKLRILDEKEKIEQNIKELEEKIKISQTCEMQNTKFTNDEYNQEIEDLKDKFLIDIESASNSFRVRQNALRDTYSNENIDLEIALAVSSLATLQKELTSIAAPPIFDLHFDESVNSINRLNDDSICNDDVNKLKDLQKQEYEDKVTSCNDKLEKLSQKYSNEEVKYSEQLEANYQVSMRNAKMMLTSQNEIKNKENEYIKTFKLENETLNSIPMVYKNNFNSNQFEKVDKMIENLNHKYFQLKSSIKIQKASLISDFELEDKEEIQRFEKKLAQLSPEQQEWVNLSQHLIEIQQLRTNEENELKNQLLILKKREQQILDDFEQKVNNINQNDNYLTLLNLLSDLQNDSNLQLHHKENEVNQEIEILEDQIKEYNEYFETEKNLINDGLTRITNELNEYQINKNERLQNIQEDFEKLINKEKEKYSQTLSRNSAIFEDKKDELSRKMDYYEKLIKDEENQHFIEFNQQLSVNNIASDDFSRSNVNQIRQMKSELVALKDFAKEQIEVVQRKLNDLIEHLQTRPPREVDRITINQLEEQTKNVTHRLQYLMKDYNLTKKLMVKKEKEYNKKFGFNPKIGILRTNPICLRPNYV